MNDKNKYNYYLRIQYLEIALNSDIHNYYPINDDGKLHMGFYPFQEQLHRNVHYYKVFQKKNFLIFNYDKELFKFKCDSNSLFKEVESRIKKFKRNDKLKNLI